MIVGISDTTNGISADYIYQLRYDKRTGKITCTCPAFCYNEKSCHHQREFLALLRRRDLV